MAGGGAPQGRAPRSRSRAGRPDRRGRYGPRCARPTPEQPHVGGHLGHDDHEAGLHQAYHVRPAPPHVLGLRALQVPEAALGTGAAVERCRPLWAAPVEPLADLRGDIARDGDGALLARLGGGSSLGRACDLRRPLGQEERERAVLALAPAGPARALEVLRPVLVGPAVRRNAQVSRSAMAAWNSATTRSFSACSALSTSVAVFFKAGTERWAGRVIMARRSGVSGQWGHPSIIFAPSKSRASRSSRAGRGPALCLSPAARSVR